MNATLTCIHQRRAVRKYQETSIDRATIEQLIDAGRMAPSAMNLQPWKFYIVNEAQMIRQMSCEIASAADGYIALAHGVHISQSGDSIFHNAPLVIFIAGPKKNEWSDLDIGMCAQNMMLAAKSMGIDSCPIGLGKFVEKTKSYSSLKVAPQDHIIFALIFGYGDEIPQGHPRRKDNSYYVTATTATPILTQGQNANRSK